ncbi:MAG: hypothetical protein WBV28_17905 [Terracidiphilus sp.]
MPCLVCRNLERAFESRSSDYRRARTAAYCRVSTQFAAYQDVEMERAKSDLQEHRFGCAAVIAEAARATPRAA